MIYLLIILAILYSLVLAFFYFSQRGMLFYPQPLSYLIQANENVEEVEIQMTEGNILRGWLCKNHSTHSRKLLIYFGGNAEEVSHLVPEASLFGDWDVLLVNYPGYGKSDGRPGEESFFNAALEIYDYAVSRMDADNAQIVVMGRSIGTASAVYLASKRKTRGVILVSPFESIRAVAQAKLPFLPVSLLLQHPFASKKYAEGIQAPVLAFYGTADNIVPPSHSKKLMEYWSGPVRLVELPGYNHNNIFDSEQLWRETERFLERF